MKRGKNYRAAITTIEPAKIYGLTDALTHVCAMSKAKFDETVEVHMRLGIDPKKSDQNVRGNAVLPHGVGKTKRVAVITTTQQKQAREAGAHGVYGEELLEAIKAGTIDFDVLIATPEMMPKLATVAKILGPRGLMPSPKAETVTTDVASSVKALSLGKVSFRNDATGVVHQAIGKASFGVEKLSENYAALYEGIMTAKPSGVKGSYILSIALCTTMSPSVRVRTVL